MSRYEPIPDEAKIAAVEGIRAGRSTRDVAAELGMSEASVRRFARGAGVHSATRVLTEKATQAKIATMAASRAELARLLLEDAHRLRAQIWEPCTVAMTVSVGEGCSTVVDHRLERPTFRDQREGITACAIALDKHLKVIQFDGSPELAAAKSLLESAFEAAAKAFGTGDEIVRED